MESRKLQRVGYSTLTLSLPKEWVQEVQLEPGDIISIKRDDDGSLKLIPAAERKREEIKNAIINADLWNSPNLLTRLITANYILGHDTIHVVGKDELRKPHVEDIRETTQHLAGVSIVEQTLKHITLQCFIDPTRFPINNLMRRLHTITSLMLDASTKDLVERRPELAAEVPLMEEESDRIYLLIARQLVLAISDRNAASKMGIESPLHIAGNTMIVKILEEMADSAENIASEILALDNREMAVETIMNGITKFSTQVTKFSEDSLKAFLTTGINLANETVERVETAEGYEHKLTQQVLAHVKNGSLAASLRIIIRNLGQIAKYCKIISEVTINRIIEKPSEICKCLPAQQRPIKLDD